MTKSELLSLLKDYPDDACIEVVRYGTHFDVQCVVHYDDYGVQIAELGIFEEKQIPESKLRKGSGYEPPTQTFENIK